MVNMLFLPPRLFHPRVHKETEAGGVSCCMSALLLLLSLSSSISNKDRTLSSLSGTLSATHRTIPITVTNDAYQSPGSRLSALNEKREGRESQARTQEVVSGGCLLPAPRITDAFSAPPACITFILSARQRRTLIGLPCSDFQGKREVGSHL